MEEWPAGVSVPPRGIWGDSMWRSKWLCGNTVLVKLEEGEAFYEQRVEVAGPAADTLFAQHLRAQRGILAGDAA